MVQPKSSDSSKSVTSAGTGSTNPDTSDNDTSDSDTSNEPLEPIKPKVSDGEKSVDTYVDVVSEDEREANENLDTEKVKIYNANDGIHGRDGGPYLDQVEAKRFEEFQASRDGSEPDYINPRGYPGIQYNTPHQQVDSYNPTTLAGDEFKDRSEFDAVPLAEVESPVPNAGQVVYTPPAPISSQTAVSKSDKDETNTNTNTNRDETHSFEDFDSKKK